MATKFGDPLGPNVAGTGGGTGLSGGPSFGNKSMGGMGGMPSIAPKKRSGMSGLMDASAAGGMQLGQLMAAQSQQQQAVMQQQHEHLTSQFEMTADDAINKGIIEPIQASAQRSPALAQFVSSVAAQVNDMADIASHTGNDDMANRIRMKLSYAMKSAKTLSEQNTEKALGQADTGTPPVQQAMPGTGQNAQEPPQQAQPPAITAMPAQESPMLSPAQQPAEPPAAMPVSMPAAQPQLSPAEGGVTPQPVPGRLGGVTRPTPLVQPTEDKRLMTQGGQTRELPGPGTIPQGWQLDYDKMKDENAPTIVYKRIPGYVEGKTFSPETQMRLDVMEAGVQSLLEKQPDGTRLFEIMLAPPKSMTDRYQLYDPSKGAWFSDDRMSRAVQAMNVVAEGFLRALSGAATAEGGSSSGSILGGGEYGREVERIRNMIMPGQFESTQQKLDKMDRLHYLMDKVYQRAELNGGKDSIPQASKFVMETWSKGMDEAKRKYGFFRETPTEATMQFLWDHKDEPAVRDSFERRFGIPADKAVGVWSNELQRRQQPPANGGQ